MAVDDRQVMRDLIQSVTAKLKKGADDFEDVKLEPNESMLLYRILTEHVGVR